MALLGLMLRVPRHDRQGALATGIRSTDRLTGPANLRITVPVEGCGLTAALSQGTRMIPQSASLRWLSVVVYAAALLGALIVPHAHHAGGSCCSHGVCHSEPAAPKREMASTCRGHHHATATGHTCRHHHHAPPAPKPTGSTPSPSAPPAAPFDADCLLCRFLAQPVQLASPPVVLTGEALTPAVPDALVVRAEPAPLTTPPVRGPPLG